jgi:hypothetical protein
MNGELLMDFLETSFSGARFMRSFSTLKYCWSLPGRKNAIRAPNRQRVRKEALGFIVQAIF